MITIQSNPSTYFSVHGDLIFTVVDIVKASDSSTYPDYRYVCDVYVDTTLVARLKAYPHPDNKIGIFNIANIVRNYITTLFSPVASQLIAQTLGLGDFSINATMKFGEEYDFTLYTNLLVDSERIYYNHYNGRLIGQLTNLSSVYNNAATLRPATSPVREDSKFNLFPFFAKNFAIRLDIRSYTDAGALIGQFDYDIPLPADKTMKVFNLSPAAINAASPGLIVQGVTSYYTVQFQRTILEIAGDDGPEYRFEMRCEPKYEIFTLHFLNKYGGFESRDFTKVSRKTIDIERSEFGKLGYTMDSSGVISYKDSNNVYNETRSAYARQYKEKMTLNTDILSDDEYTWLADLILSPMVYVEMVSSGTSYFLPCVITANNYEFRKSVNDRLTNLTLDIEFGEQFNSQYR